LKTDFSGLPIAFHLTASEASDSRNFETLLDIGPDINPRAALGDKGYDSKSNREAARQRGGFFAAIGVSLLVGLDIRIGKIRNPQGNGRRTGSGNSAERKWQRR
jgi:hypothetical protein